jgi:NAD+ kinase
MTRRILLVAHPRRVEAQHFAGDVAAQLHAAGLQVALLPDAAEATILGGSPNIITVDPDDPARGCELVCVLGGDGAILRGAALSRGTEAPLLGINLGHVGFLAEAEREKLVETVEQIVARDYVVEERMTLEVTATHDHKVIARSWALNEVTVEKAARERMLEVTLEIDGRPLSTCGCDGVVIATPTGSTAYAFSAGGPVMWPDVEAMVVVPISAHALFARPLVVGPHSALAIELVADADGAAVMWCDGSRTVELPPGARVDVCRSDIPVRLARLSAWPFADRLVAKFDLSVTGWRGARNHGGSGGGSGSGSGSGSGMSHQA